MAKWLHSYSARFTPNPLINVNAAFIALRIERGEREREHFCVLHIIHHITIQVPRLTCLTDISFAKIVHNEYYLLRMYTGRQRMNLHSQSYTHSVVTCCVRQCIHGFRHQCPRSERKTTKTVQSRVVDFAGLFYEGN